MPLNLNATESYYRFDEAGMLIVPSDELSRRDSIGRMVLAWIAYERPRELNTALAFCLANISDNDTPQWILYRHPDKKELASRDHWSYFIIQSYLLNKEWTIEEFIPHISKMRGMNNWMKALAGNKCREWWYYFWNIPFAYLGNWWLKRCREIGEIEPERSNDHWINTWDLEETWGHLIQRKHTHRQKLWAWIIFKTIPAYALQIKAWQIWVLPASKKKAKLQGILLKRVGKSNILVRLVLNDKTVTQEEIDNYPAMTGFRPGVYLDETCQRTIRKMTNNEAEFNMYELDLIKWLWKKNIQSQ